MMFHRSTGIFVSRFLGLWGASQVDTTKDPDDRANDPRSELVGKKTINESDSAAINSAIKLSSKRILALTLEKGIPGLTICVSKQGKTVWRAAFGFCDVENQLQCSPEAHMRIASISKSLFATTVVAPMLEQNKLTLNDSLHDYLSIQEFPKQTFEGCQHDITVEQLLSHTSGIRHYPRWKPEESLLRPIGSKGSKKVYQDEDQYNRQEFYQRHTFRNVMEALDPIKDGPLASKPGEFNYTSYGYTVMSAIAQKVHQKNEMTESEQIEDFWIKILRRDWDMTDTFLDQDEVIIPNRAKYYLRSSFNGELINAPYQDTSIKWASGGINSTTEDLVKFGRGLIDSYKSRESAILKRETIDSLWKTVKNSYALGFKVQKMRTDTGKEKLVVSHDGCALGASSVLIIYPDSEIVVAILTNLGYVNLNHVGQFIADQFEKLD